MPREQSQSPDRRDPRPDDDSNRTRRDSRHEAQYRNRRSDQSRSVDGRDRRRDDHRAGLRDGRMKDSSKYGELSYRSSRSPEPSRSTYRNDDRPERPRGSERRRQRSLSSSRSSSSSSGSDADRRKREMSRNRSPERAKESDRHRRERKEDKRERRRRREDKKARKEAKRAAQGKISKRSFGQCGILTETDINTKDSEFRLWLIEEKMLNPETLPKRKEVELFKSFADDWNTMSLPDKYYDLASHERQKQSVAMGNALLPLEGTYDFRKDEADIKQKTKAGPAKTRIEDELSYEALQELRRVQRERHEGITMKKLGLKTRESLGVRYEMQ